MRPAGRCVAQLVNCATPRADKRHRAVRPFVAARLNCSIRVGIPREQRLGQRSFEHRISAPRVMPMHRTRLTGLPDERGDGIAAERIGDQQMPPITIQPAFTLGIGQKAGFPGQAIESRPYAQARIPPTTDQGNRLDRVHRTTARAAILYQGQRSWRGSSRWRNQAERSGKLSFFYTGLHVEKVSI